MIDFTSEDVQRIRCEFTKTQIYEHIDEQIKTEHVFSAWIASNDSLNKEYVVRNQNLNLMCTRCRTLARKT